MPNITGFTAARTQEIEDKIIETAAVVGGHLIFTRHDGSTYDAGDIRGGEQIPHSKVAAVTSAGGSTNLTTHNALAVPLSVTGFQKYRADTKLICMCATGIYNDEAFGYFETAIYIGGVNKAIMTAGYSTHGAKTGVREITGMPAGTYTISLYYRKGTSGVGTVFDGNSGAKNELMVTETF